MLSLIAISLNAEEKHLELSFPFSLHLILANNPSQSGFASCLSLIHPSVNLLTCGKRALRYHCGTACRNQMPQTCATWHQWAYNPCAFSFQSHSVCNASSYLEFRAQLKPITVIENSYWIQLNMATSIRYNEGRKSVWVRKSTMAMYHQTQYFIRSVAGTPGLTMWNHPNACCACRNFWCICCLTLAKVGMRYSSEEAIWQLCMLVPYWRQQFGDKKCPWIATIYCR